MLEWLRKYCLAFPGATEQVQWENSLLFKVAGKMFAVAALEPDNQHFLAIKCQPESFEEMVERPGIDPAPYLARAKWIAFETEDAVPHAELKELIASSYQLVVAKLPKKTREGLTALPSKRRRPAR